MSGVVAGRGDGRSPQDAEDIYESRETFLAMFDGPPCPNCGRSFLVRRQRTGGIFFGHTIERHEIHRCYRCFHSFSAADDGDE